MSDQNTIRRAYDEIAEVYAAQRSGEHEAEVLDNFLDPLSEEAYLLDAGCGQGTPVLSRLSESTTAVGLDFSHEQLQLATKNAPTAALSQGDMTALPFQDETFDAVTAFHSMIHIPIDKHQQVIDEFARVLRSEGRLLLSEGEIEWSGANPDWLGTGVEMHWDMAGSETTQKQLRSAGFSIVGDWGIDDTFAKDDSQKPFFFAQLNR